MREEKVPGEWLFFLNTFSAPPYRLNGKTTFFLSLASFLYSISSSLSLISFGYFHSGLERMAFVAESLQIAGGKEQGFVTTGSRYVVHRQVLRCAAIDAIVVFVQVFSS
jgi:hypothetical protein